MSKLVLQLTPVECVETCAETCSLDVETVVATCSVDAETCAATYYVEVVETYCCNLFWRIFRNVLLKLALLKLLKLAL